MRTIEIIDYRALTEMCRERFSIRKSIERIRLRRMTGRSVFEGSVLRSRFPHLTLIMARRATK
jgi:hypothetical protein